MEVSQYGTLALQLGQNVFTPGKQLNGVVLFNATSPMQGNAMQVYLELSGFEHVSLNEHKVEVEYVKGWGERGRGKKKVTYRNIRHEQQQPMASARLPVYTFSGSGVSPGMYSFPFSFMMPNDLPSSFGVNFFNPPNMNGPEYQCSAKVEYILNACISPGTHSALPIKCKLPIVVNQGSVANMGPYRSESTRQNKTCFCIDDGPTKLTTQFEKNEYCPGETAYVMTEVDNSASSAAVQSVTVTFAQKCTLQAGAYRHQLNFDHQSIQVHGAAAKTKSPVQRSEIRLLDKMGLIISPSCRGKIVQNEYFLVSKAIVSSMLDFSDEVAQSYLQLTLKAPDVAVQPQWRPPQNWAPQVMSNPNQGGVQMGANYPMTPAPQVAGYPTQPTMQASGYPAVPQQYQAQPQPMVIQVTLAPRAEK